MIHRLWSSTYIQTEPELPSQAMDVLLVEDNPGDTKLMQLVWGSLYIGSFAYREGRLGSPRLSEALGAE